MTTAVSDARVLEPGTKVRILGDGWAAGQVARVLRLATPFPGRWTVVLNDGRRFLAWPSELTIVSPETPFDRAIEAAS